ncbi:hypothetical protein N9J98_02060 [Flavobacteriaceae bacterium]|nr:hypothetical protein [Flavobacteriaceae bacterium]
MISKIVFFRYIPLTELISKGHFMDWLLKKGIIVEYLDLSKLFFPNYNSQDRIIKDFVVEINNYSDFKAYVKSQNKKTTLFISIVTFEWRVYRLFRILTQHNCKLGVFARGIIPLPDVKSITKIKRVLMHFSIKNIMAILKNKALYFSKKLGYIKPYDIIYLTGEAAFPAIGIGFHFDRVNADIINVNTADYDTFLSLSDIAPVATNYAVFLDENLTSHPDQKLFNIPPISSQDYYPELNAFFDKIESDFNIKIIIAAHPKALNYKVLNPYNREIYFNQTNELVSNSNFVITHDSTSIGYAVLHKKPILSITSEKFKIAIPENHAYTLSFSKALNTSLLYYDTNRANKKDIKIDIDKYNSYKYSFLTNKSTEGKLTKYIFLKSLKSI